MSDSDHVSRRDLIVKTAGVACATSALSGVAAAMDQTSRALPLGFDNQAPPLKEHWHRELSEVTNVDPGLARDVPELAREPVKERHRIYCYLLMKLIYRFWNGNKHGPLGQYLQRKKQIEYIEGSSPNARYRGDMISNPEGTRVNWDRYLGHNIACIAVDGNGVIMDFDFNHNDFFRSTVEHAESRLVRRLFCLTDRFDSWRTGQPIGNRSRTFSLNEVTLYTSLESCAQCSGIMSLAGVKQIIYLQNDFTAYMIGNIMYNLANRNTVRDSNGLRSLPGAPVPIPASKIDLDEFKRLNEASIAFCNLFINSNQVAGVDKTKQQPAFFVPVDGTNADTIPSITSFLCTDDAREILGQGADKLNSQPLRFPSFRFPEMGPDRDKVLTNQECLAEARRFYEYADINCYRGSPHRV